MNRHNLPLAWHAETDMSAIGWVMIAYSSNCLISKGWLASIAEGDSVINATLLYYMKAYFCIPWPVQSSNHCKNNTIPLSIPMSEASAIFTSHVCLQSSRGTSHQDSENMRKGVPLVCLFCFFLGGGVVCFFSTYIRVMTLI